MLSRVVYSENDQLDSRVFDLQRSTISQICKQEMTFCYYQEVDQETVYTGLQSMDGAVKVFVKLVNNEPVDLSIDEWNEQWARFPELIPLDV